MQKPHHWQSQNWYVDLITSSEKQQSNMQKGSILCKSIMSYFIELRKMKSLSQLNEFDGTEQFAGGYPAIFGGTDKGSVNETLIAEVSEESRNTFQAFGPFQPYFQGQPPNNNLLFYWTSKWEVTGNPWKKPLQRDEGEMSAIVTISLDGFTSHDPPQTVLKKLVHLSGAPGGSEKQEKSFFDSETAAAFIQFVYACVPNK